MVRNFREYGKYFLRAVTIGDRSISYLGLSLNGILYGMNYDQSAKRSGIELNVVIFGAKMDTFAKFFNFLRNQDRGKSASFLRNQDNLAQNCCAS